MTKQTDRKTSVFKSEQELYQWCLDAASLRYMGKLEQYKIDKLNALDFPWAYYEDELDSLGYHWEKNNPNGIRYKDLQ